MTRKMTRILVLSFLMIGLSFAGFSQTQTGSIRGVVTEEDGNPLPGATVTITSPALMGTLSFVTDARGRYRFPACPPGEYQMKVEMPGFASLDRTEIIVHVGLNVDINLTMRTATLEEEVTVTAPSPLVDTKASKMTSHVTDEMVENLPVGREVYELMKTVASVVDEGPSSRTHRKGVSIHGGHIYQTKYAVDGVMLEDPSLGSLAHDISFDSIDEVEIITAGFPAEVGGLSAGYINVVSKSGGNKFSGGVIFQYTGESLQQSTVPTYQLEGMGLAQPEIDKRNLDFSLTFGGPIIKDRVWFFINPQIKEHSRGSPFIPFTDSSGEYHPPYDIDKKYYMGSFKLSAQISDRIKYMGTYGFLDSEEDPSSVIAGPKMPYDAQAYVPEYDWHLSSVLSFIIDQNTFADAQVAYVYRRYEWLDVAARDGRIVPRIYDRYTGYAWNRYWRNESYERSQWSGALKITRFQDDFLGADHEFKAGVEFASAKSASEYWSENNWNLYWYNGTPWYWHNYYPYVGLSYVYSNGVKQGDNPMHNEFTKLGFFIQDSITIRQRLTVNVGLRFDSTHASRPDDIRKGWEDPYYNGLLSIIAPDTFTTEDMVSPGLKNIMVWNLWQPRIGITYDLFGDGRTALKATLSRYPEAFTTQLLGGLHAFGAYDGAEFEWYDYNRNGEFDLPPVDGYYVYYEPRIILDPEEFKKKVDSNLSAPYVDEVTVGIQHELMKDLSLGMNIIYKEEKNIVETLDRANPLDGDMWLPYEVTDPGDDQTFGTGDDQQLTVYAQKREAEVPFTVKTNVEEARRKYWGFEFIMFKRMSNNWQLNASVTYSKSYGNVGSGGWDTTGAQGYFTSPNSLINRWGRGTWDRPLMIKLTGTVLLPYGINVSAFYRHLTGAPFEREGRTSLNRTLTVFFPETVNGFQPKVSNVVVMAEPHGSKRTKNLDMIDLRAEKEFNIGFGRLGIILDVFNILGYSRVHIDTNNGGYLYPDGTFEAYPNAGQILSLQEGSRIVKFGIKFLF
ncbi:carboxypeptidase regulatory-like domain-containing protein [Acidobacteriota bacterium]